MLKGLLRLTPYLYLDSKLWAFTVPVPPVAKGKLNGLLALIKSFSKLQFTLKINFTSKLA